MASTLHSCPLLCPRLSISGHNGEDKHKSASLGLARMGLDGGQVIQSPMHNLIWECSIGGEKKKIILAIKVGPPTFPGTKTLFCTVSAVQVKYWVGRWYSSPGKGSLHQTWIRTVPREEKLKFSRAGGLLLLNIPSKVHSSPSVCIGTKSKAWGPHDQLLYVTT